MHIICKVELIFAHKCLEKQNASSSMRQFFKSLLIDFHGTKIKDWTYSSLIWRAVNIKNPNSFAYIKLWECGFYVKYFNTCWKSFASNFSAPKSFFLSGYAIGIWAGDLLLCLWKKRHTVIMLHFYSCQLAKRQCPSFISNLLS